MNYGDTLGGILGTVLILSVLKFGLDEITKETKEPLFNDLP